MPPRLARRIALITGGGGGIGAATGRLFAEEGASVALVDTDPAAVESVAASIRGGVHGAAALPIVADVAQEGEARRAVEETVARFDALHVVVNVAGIRLYTPLAEADAKDWERILGVNVLATAYTCKAAVPHLRAAGGGAIVNVSSVYGVMGRSGMGQYDTTKAALLGFTRALAVEEAPHRIRVNVVCPGGTITPYHIRRAAEIGVSEAQLRASRQRDNLLGRFAEPREVAYPILFLACEESSFVTGATLMVDAGRSIL
ncbi:MAG TPA: SDR family NAD(P)-dependent oxidoreductase [Candidatus Binatia bacterium]|nr:SDR family NAD(P)-dependent oxidoreductase [Candidatus Binatia bacterium]